MQVRLVVNLHQIRVVFGTGEDDIRYLLAARAAVESGGRISGADRIDRASQRLQVESVEEGPIRAAVDLEEFGRAGDARGERFDRSTSGQKRYGIGQTQRVGQAA